MTSADLLSDAFTRIREVVHQTVHGLGPDLLGDRLDGATNSVAWLIWHLTRVQDDHVAEVARTDQRWTADGWYDRFALPLPRSSIGYGHTSEEVGAVQVASPQLLTGYYDAVHEQTLRFVGQLTDADLDRVVDERWDPPVTLGVRLVSVISDDLQHAGQAAYLRGVLERRQG